MAELRRADRPDRRKEREREREREREGGSEKFYLLCSRVRRRTRKRTKEIISITLLSDNANPARDAATRSCKREKAICSAFYLLPPTAWDGRERFLWREKIVLTLITLVVGRRPDGMLAALCSFVRSFAPRRGERERAGL